MISTLRLQNFRSYTDDSFEFGEGVNIVVGPNGSGKTNLLEAILVLARGSSYRVRDAELLQFNKPWARLDGYFAKQSRTIKIEPPSKTFIIDDNPYKRLSLDKTFPAVLFEPNHLQVISRGPDQRREYFDDLLARSQVGFKKLAGGYQRTLAQRNALLKRNRHIAHSQMFAWNIRLSQLGSQVAEARQQLSESINETLSKNYSQIAKQKSVLKLVYECQFPVNTYASKMLSKLETSTELEFDRGFTAYGPHREDFTFYLNSQPVSQTASRGETRSLLLALKMFELGLIEKATNQKPLFLLDDVFSELDGARRKALVSLLKKHQTIITTTDSEAVIGYFPNQHTILTLG